MTEIGLLLPTREAVIYGDESGDPRPLVDLARWAESAGFDSVWAGDSLLARPRAEPLTLLAAVAAATERVKLGTGVLLPSQRNAEQLAQSTATLDAVSGGRFILGIGAGPDTPGVRRDHELLGVDMDRRNSVAMGVIERTRALWRGDGDDQMYPLPVTPGGPPIWMGGHGPRTLERTGRICDAWFPTATSHEMYAAGLAQVREHAEAAGRDPSEVGAAAYLTVVIGETGPAEAALAEHSQLYYGVPHDVIARMQGSVAGPKELVIEWLRGFVDAGATHICVRIGSADVHEQAELIADALGELRS